MGVVTAAVENAELATVSPETSEKTDAPETFTITKKGDAFGSTAIAITAEADGNYTAATAQLAVEVLPITRVLNDNTWEKISTAASMGIAANYWAVGDCKTIAVQGTVGTLGVYETWQVYILGFDHNGAANTIDFGSFRNTADAPQNVMVVDSKYGSYVTDGTLYFNPNHWGNYNYGGWAGCDLRYDILGSTDTRPSDYGAAVAAGRTGYDASESCAVNPVENTLMSALPADLRAVMKPMTVYTNNAGGSANTEDLVTPTVDYLPLLAEFEVFGKRTSANSYEQNHQAQYQYYADGNSPIKYKHSDGTTAAIGWLRSPNVSTANFCDVTAAGAASTAGARYSYGLAPIFRV